VPKKRPPAWRKFWRDWGLYLAILLVLAVTGVLITVLSRRTPEIATDRPYRLYFTQSDLGYPAPEGLEAEILKDVDGATAFVDVATPRLDLPLLAQGLVRARERGVTVRVLQNPPAAADSAVISVTNLLESHGVTVTLHPSGTLGGAFVVVDQKVVWAGSWDLSQEGLFQDAAYVLRWEIPRIAEDFHREFEEMVEQRAFGPASPKETAHRFIAILDVASMDVYMTPEDDPLADILQRMAASRHEIVVMTEVLNDPRIEQRLIDQSPLSGTQVWGVVGRAQNLTANLEKLLQIGVQIPPYRGSGEMRENAILLDGRVTVILSQRLVQERLDRYDGYVLVVVDDVLTQAIGREFRRLFGLSVPTPAPPIEPTAGAVPTFTPTSRP